MSVLKSLGCGVPVCNGQIVAQRLPQDLARAIADCLDHLDQYRGKPAVTAVQDFAPQNVLVPVFENYRRLASKGTGGD